MATIKIELTQNEISQAIAKHALENGFFIKDGPAFDYESGEISACMTVELAPVKKRKARASKLAAAAQPAKEKAH